MSATVSKYRKLPGAARSSIGTEELWQGDDHLLVVESGWGPERYRRFYYREIRAFFIQRTNTRLGWNIVCGILAALLAIGPLALLARMQRTGSYSLGSDMLVGGITAGVSGAIMLVFLAALVINSLLGPGCRLYILMGAGLERVGAPRRERQAKKIIERLTPEIERFQGASGAPAAASNMEQVTPTSLQPGVSGI